MSVFRSHSLLICPLIGLLAATPPRSSLSLSQGPRQISNANSSNLFASLDWCLPCSPLHSSLNLLTMLCLGSHLTCPQAEGQITCGASLVGPLLPGIAVTACQSTAEKRQYTLCFTVIFVHGGAGPAPVS